jgi:transcriptional regulator with XRE-family HTH domain
MKLSDFVKQRRKELGLTQRELSRAAGQDSGWICMIEAGLRNCGNQTAEPLAKVLGVREEVLHLLSGHSPVLDFREDISMEDIAAAIDEFKAKVANTSWQG